MSGAGAAGGVRLGAATLLVDGRELPVYSGAVHYWRLERAHWPRILDQVIALGFQLIETYIPWSVHEPSPGHFDWGAHDPRKDVEAFMRLCEARGLRLMVRPGPLINAELTDFGFPEWLLLDPAVQARTALGSLHLDAAWGLHPPRPFPVPSYASERFFALVGGWFDAVCPIIRRHLAPAGCIVAVQSDNETCYLFHDQPYATDYAPDALRLYRAFLQERYPDIARLNAHYGTHYASFDQVEPPRDGPIQTPADAAWRLDWVAAKEHQIRWSVARLARMLRQRGIVDVPIFHDVAYQLGTPIDIARLEANPEIDWVGLNLYRPPWEHRALADRARFLAGSTRLPFVPEFGAGTWSHHPLTPTPDEQAFVTLSGLMYGIKALSFYMLVERERWQGSPITRHGTLRAEYATFYCDLLRFLREQRFWQYARRPAALVLFNYDLGRYDAANSTLNWAHTDLLNLPAELFFDEPGPDLPRTAPAHAWLETLVRALEARSIDYDLADSHVADAHLQRYPLVFVQCAGFLDVADQRRLAAYARRGGQLVLGPAWPRLDHTLRPCPPLEASAASLATAADLPALLDGLLPTPEFRSAELAVIPHYDAAHHRTLVFVANPTPSACDGILRFDGQRTFHSAWGAAETWTADSELRLHLEPWTLRILQPD